MSRRLAALVLLAAALLARPARASVEEFSTFDPFASETDDESAIDRWMARPPAEWRDEWDAAHNALRADQGCFTSAAWYQSNEFKVRSPLGRRSWLDIGFLQRTDLEASWQWLQFDLHRATRRYGVIGWRVRPAYDKSTQDFAALWDAGDASTPLQVHAAFTFEDAFNKFWEFKQERVGGRAEPYAAHPFEPALAMTWRGRRHRAEASGTWLTPSRKDIVDPDPAQSGAYALWGAKAAARVDGTFGAHQVALAFEDVQARSARSFASVPGDGRFYRRRWSTEARVRRTLGPKLRLEGSWVYDARESAWRPPLAAATFRSLDRIAALELGWRVRPDWLVRAGLLHDRVGVTTAGPPPGFAYGSRRESRAYFGFQAKFDRVRLQVLEGIELDSEPYTVSFHHDKTFLHLQTTF